MNTFKNQNAMVYIIGLFSLLYIVSTTFSNPIENTNFKDLILDSYCIYTLIILFYCIYCIISTMIHSNSKKDPILVVGIIFFFFAPIITGEGLLEKTGIIILLLNMLIWWIYYIKYKEKKFLVLTLGVLINLLVFSYCEILWD